MSSSEANIVSIFTQHNLRNLYRYHYCFLFTKTNLGLLTCSTIYTHTYVYIYTHIHLQIHTFIYIHTRTHCPTAITNRSSQRRAIVLRGAFRSLMARRWLTLVNWSPAGCRPRGVPPPSRLIAVVGDRGVRLCVRFQIDLYRRPV